MRLEALRFDYPSPTQAGGFSTRRDGRLATVSGHALIRQSLMMILTTRPGERVMRPDFGCSLHELLFAIPNGTTAGLAMHYVREAVERWEPRVDVLNVRASWNSDRPTVLQVVLDYRIRGRVEEQTVAWEYETAPGM